MAEHRRSTTFRSGMTLLGVFLLTGVFFFFLQSSSTFPDPDSFYHIKAAQLIMEQGVVDDFPWATFSTLTAHYTDQHFLYHAYLAPFVTVFEPVFGAKLATVVLNAALMTVLAGFLLSFRVRWWWLFCGILLVTNPFLFRINLVKAPGLSILLLILGLWFLFRRRYLPLGILGFVYVWTYGGFVLLGFFAVVYAVCAALLHWHHRSLLSQLYRRLPLRTWRWHSVWRSPWMRLVLATGLGLIIGVILNPYFPKNLFFYWEQLVQIGIVNFQEVVNVGGEWHPYGFVELLANNVFVAIAVLVALVLFVVQRRRMSAESWTLAVLAIFFFLITLKSRRYVELYVPFATLFAAFALRDALPKTRFADLWRSVHTMFEKRWTLATLLLLYVVGATAMVIVRDERQLFSDLGGGFRTDYLESASDWLAENTPQGSIVVHSDWDEFPILLYHNDHNRYIVGLDPTFMYQYDSVLYQRWADLTSGRRNGDASSIITQDLGSSIVLVAKDHEPFHRTMERQEAFSLVYEDDDAWIYRLSDSAWPPLPTPTQ